MQKHDPIGSLTMSEDKIHEEEGVKRLQDSKSKRESESKWMSLSAGKSEKLIKCNFSNFKYQFQPFFVIISFINSKNSLG